MRPTLNFNYYTYTEFTSVLFMGYIIGQLTNITILIFTYFMKGILGSRHLPTVTNRLHFFTII